MANESVIPPSVMAIDLYHFFLALALEKRQNNNNNCECEHFFRFPFNHIGKVKYLMFNNP